jgi:hypothetical protein
MKGREIGRQIAFLLLAIVVDGTVLQQARFDCVRYRALQICQSLQSLRLGRCRVCAWSAIGAIDCVSTLNTVGSLDHFHMQPISMSIALNEILRQCFTLTADFNVKSICDAASVSVEEGHR